MIEDKLGELRERLATIHDINAANALLAWDQQTYMPEGAIADRAEGMATLSRIAHEMFTDAKTGNLLDNLKDHFDADSDERAIVRVARRSYDRATKLPAALVQDLTRTTTLAEPAWAEARAKSDWNLFAPHLEKIVELQRRVAEAYGYTTHPYDALLDEYEPGLTKRQIEIMFDELKGGIVPLVKAIAEQNAEDQTAPLHGNFDEAKQEQFGRDVITRFGYDWTRGRQDRTVHPFCINFGSSDVRITTRFDSTWLSPALFGTLHEAGHGMYEQGVDPKYRRTPLSGGTSMGIHESQSRLWENMVGRSRVFWQRFYPDLQELYPEQLTDVSLEDFYRAINEVRPSMIRVEADEVTYNLHVLLRFELETALLEGSLKVADVPAAWNAKMTEYLGITPTNDAEGALQDIHWAGGMFAYFPTYTIGNVLAVQLYEKAIETYPTIPDEIAQGEFANLYGWLRENIYQYGSKYEPNELIERATGRTLDTAPYLRYLHKKFGELYNLN